MDTLLSKKIVLGSTIKANNKAKMYGQLCLEDLSLMKIILELKNYCELNINYDNAEILGSMARKLQVKNKSICNYRNKNYSNKKFIN